MNVKKITNSLQIQNSIDLTKKPIKNNKNILFKG